MIPSSVIATAERAVRDALADWPPQWTGFHWPGYTLQHTERVRRLARRLAADEGADIEVVGLAALLHDVAKAEGEDHAQRGAERTRALLDGALPPERVAQIAATVAAHNAAVPGDPIEWRVLSDADKVDANFGLVAVTRYFTIRGSRGHGLDEALAWVPEWDERHVALLERLSTEAGRRCAEERLAVMRAFCKEATADGAARAVARFFLGDWERPVLDRQVQRVREGAIPGASQAATKPFAERLAREIRGEV